MFARFPKKYPKSVISATPHGYCSNATKDGEKPIFTGLFAVFIVYYLPTGSVKFHGGKET